MRREFLDYEPDKTEDSKDALHELEARLGYTFHDINNLELAMIHASSTSSSQPNNERLEFFGDAIISLIVCEHLFYTYTDLQEGDLTKIKSVLVQGKTLANICRNLGLRDYMRLGRGIRHRAELPDSVYANIFEALAAAIYMDGGYLPARDFVVEQMEKGDVVHEAVKTVGKSNPKAMLQEFAQKHYATLPQYSVIGTFGPDHNKTFEVDVKVNDKIYAKGEGKSKKLAEQIAAEIAFRRLRDEWKEMKAATKRGACRNSADQDTARQSSATAAESQTEATQD